MRCKFTWTKIIGTILCLSGVIAMSFLQSPTTSSKLTSKVSSGDKNEMEWIIGCGYLFISVVMISCVTVLQVYINMQYKLISYHQNLYVNHITPETLHIYITSNTGDAGLINQNTKSIIRTSKYKFTFTHSLMHYLDEIGLTAFGFTAGNNNANFQGSILLMSRYIFSGCNFYCNNSNYC